MIFVGDLCVALGVTLATVDAMSAAEFAFWRTYRDKKGFPADRIEGGVAIAGAATCNAWGAKYEPQDLLPRFGVRKVSLGVLAGRLAALPGAKVTRIPRPDRKKQGRQPVVIDGPVRPKPGDVVEETPTSRTLNPQSAKRRKNGRR